MTRQSHMAAGPYEAFRVEPKARQRSGFSHGVHSTHPSESGRAIALFGCDEWGEEAASEAARLFAAAPKLVAACRAVKAYGLKGRTPEGCWPYDMCCDALAALE